MSRTHRNARGAGKEYWSSRLHRHGEEPGAYTKKVTHRKERRVGKRTCRDIAEDM